MKYKNIIVYNSTSYNWITKSKVSNDTIPINIITIKELKLKNNRVINVLTMIIAVVLLGGMLVVGVINEFDNEFDD